MASAFASGGLVCRREEVLARQQLAAIVEFVALAEDMGAPVWLRGGWAMDFFLGRITRDHADVDWFALATDGPQLADGLISYGFEDVTATPPGQQIDLVRGQIEHGVALLRLDDQGEPLVAGGPWTGEPWPVGMLDGPVGRIGDVKVRVIAPLAQIEIKEMTPKWNPRLSRRQRDVDDIVAIRSRLSEALRG